MKCLIFTLLISLGAIASADVFNAVKYKEVQLLCIYEAVEATAYIELNLSGNGLIDGSPWQANVKYWEVPLQNAENQPRKAYSFDNKSAFSYSGFFSDVSLNDLSGTIMRFSISALVLKGFPSAISSSIQIQELNRQLVVSKGTTIPCWQKKIEI